MTGNRYLWRGSSLLYTWNHFIHFQLTVKFKFSLVVGASVHTESSISFFNLVDDESANSLFLGFSFVPNRFEVHVFHLVFNWLWARLARRFCFLLFLLDSYRKFQMARSRLIHHNSHTKHEISRNIINCVQKPISANTKCERRARNPPKIVWCVVSSFFCYLWCEKVTNPIVYAVCRWFASDFFLVPLSLSPSVCVWQTQEINRHLFYLINRR